MSTLGVRRERYLLGTNVNAPFLDRIREYLCPAIKISTIYSGTSVSTLGWGGGGGEGEGLGGLGT